jgi:5-methylcytosine-specific restriction endonuclease McrA
MSDSTNSSQYKQLPLFPTKCCSKCSIEYPCTPEFWHKGKKGRGLRSQCKTCRNNENYQYKRDNPEKIQASNIRYRENNPDRVQESMLRFRKNNRERLREKRKDRYRRNAEKERAASRLSRSKVDRNKIRAWAAKWYKANTDKAKQYARRYYARKKGAEGSHTKSEIQGLYQQQQGKCFHCDTDISTSYHRDHWIPLSRGGSDYIENIRLLCPVCNSRKHDKMPWEWDSRYLPPE